MFIKCNTTSATEVFFSTYWRYTNKIIIIIIIIIIIHKVKTTNKI